MEKQNNLKLVKVFTGKLWLAAMVQDMLGDKGIPVVLDNDYKKTISKF